MNHELSLAVTGSTGYVGGAVARLLAAAGARQRLLARSPERAPALPGAEPVLSSYGDRGLAAGSLAGIDLLFMVSGAEAPDRLAQHFSFIDAASDAGVGHIVYTSFYGAAPDASFTLARDHFATEEHIKASGMAFTFLRDNLYLDFLPAMVGDDGVIRGPAGDGVASVVARDDVARTAAAILQDPEPHRNASYDLTGPEELSLGAAAAVLSEETGRPVSFHNETIAEAYESRQGYGAQEWQLHAWVSTYTAIARGELAGLSGAVEEITGQAPLTLRAFLRANGR